MAAHAEEVRSQVKTYLMVFAALAVLTVITVLASFLKIGLVGGIVLALLIASLKGTLVASYFMHLLHERAALYWILILCVLFFAALILIPVLQQSETAALIDQLER